MVLRPVGSSGFGRVSSSTYGRFRPVTVTPKSRSRSAHERSPATRGYCGSSDFHTWIGEPQNRFRLIDQSRALASHLPNEPPLTCAGVQVISRFSSTIRSRNVVTATNQD